MGQEGGRGRKTEVRWEGGVRWPSCDGGQSEDVGNTAVQVT